ncbi:MAG: UbiH/UbiF/VisC/COQ6 family ubiquinone biosynthesis hydroxylase [Cyanobacteriota bacterium]|nr:UbiH/UbiF/VisC/COQ6 family ubiquinone biosynthesis hydroxylase [Cyanobacteriota bacterium]
MPQHQTIFSSPADYDVVIVGAGMVGSTLAVALGQAGLRVGLIEARPLSLEQGQTRLGSDGRASALSLGTAQLLEQLGVWPSLQQVGVSPIRQIQISDGNWPQVARLHHQEVGAEALGYIVENQVTQAGLRQALRALPQVDWICPAQVTHCCLTATAACLEVQVLGQEGEDSCTSGDRLTTRSALVVAADGMHSPLRQQLGIPTWGWRYAQSCIVSTVQTERPHQQIAYERFQASGPFAILPLTDPQQVCVVWTVKGRDQERLMALSEQDFLAAMAPSFGTSLGKLLKVNQRACYAPQRCQSQRYVAERFALLGDAAHTTHPVGGQGVNMGMRDVAYLASLLSHAHSQREDLGSPHLLQRYATARQAENRSILWATDLANRLFSNRYWPLLWGRRLGLVGLDYLPTLKQALMRRAMGIAADQPRLALSTKPFLSDLPEWSGSGRAPVELGSR